MLVALGKVVQAVWGVIGWSDTGAPNEDKIVGTPRCLGAFLWLSC